MTNEELKQHRKIAGRLARIATGTSPLCVCAASTLLQRSTKLLYLLSLAQKYLNAKEKSKISTISYVPIH